MVLASTIVIAAPEKPLTVVSWGGSYTRSQMLAYVKPYRDKKNEWVQMEAYNGGLDEIRTQVETANVIWDVVDFELADLIRGCREGLLEKINHSTLPPGADGTPAKQDFIAGSFTDCGVGQTIWSTVVGYNAERFKDTRPATLADFFDVAKFPGGRGLRRDPRVIMEWALMADGVAPGQVYSTLESEQGQKRAFAVIDRF
jgi:putative spermidine/putrescine transport system substrate-binding protein